MTLFGYYKSIKYATERKAKMTTKTLRSNQRGMSSIKAAVRYICESRAIDCGYAALANAIEGRSWERRHYMNLMRRFMSLANETD